MKALLEIFYAAGPGNVGKTFDYWLNGKEDPSQTHRTYSGQFYDLCNELKAHGTVMSHHNSSFRKKGKNIFIKHIPKKLKSANSLVYHIREVMHGFRILFEALKSGAEFVVVVDEGMTHWFMLWPLCFLRKKVIASIFCIFWNQGKEPKGFSGWLLKFNVIFLVRHAYKLLVTSDNIKFQVESIAGKKISKCKVFLPSYRREYFKDIPQKDRVGETIKIMFAGRIEENKGVFDLLAIAKRFKEEGHSHIYFGLCGDGSAFSLLKQKVEAEGLSECFNCHGHCNHETFKSFLKRADMIIVPTRSSFCEGCNQVVVEGLLSKRPVITSAVCIGVEAVREAVVEVPTDDVQAYGDAILELINNLEYYKEKCNACEQLQEIFFDLKNSWGSQLREILMEGAET